MSRKTARALEPVRYTAHHPRSGRVQASGVTARQDMQGRLDAVMLKDPCRAARPRGVALADATMADFTI